MEDLAFQGSHEGQGTADLHIHRALNNTEISFLYHFGFVVAYLNQTLEAKVQSQ